MIKEMRKKVLFLLMIFSVALSAQIKKTTPLTIDDMTDRITYGYREANNRKIDIIVIHSTYYVNVDSFSVQGVLKQFKQYGVGSHYIIDRDGNIRMMVKEKDVAFHAGKSELPGTNRRMLNTNSIGIEIINTPTTPPTDQQMESLIYLVQDIKKRYPIQYVVRHSDIAPGRKTDPWCFNWAVFNQMLEYSQSEF
jgi:N-acetyl-anhydromuramyl-L-alanine amidase AmpD